jgi:1-deoxy-D-xylulose-5-phosphate reductoisomerase
MRMPIQYALTYPEKLSGLTSELDLTKAGNLEFTEPDPKRFRCLKLAYDALEIGGTAPAVLNAANEVAVELFLAGRVAFTDIPVLAGRVVEARPPLRAGSLEVILEEDRAARKIAYGLAG